MKARSITLAVTLALSLFAPVAWAEPKAAAVIEFSSGDDIVVIRAGRRLPTREPIGLELFEGDQVQTGDGVFVEIRLASGGAVIKLAENTTFAFERIADGQTSLQLVYGRIRAKVEKLAGTDTFSVRSSQAIAGVRGTDFGIDVVASRSAAMGSTTTSAYCFEGSVEVTAFVRSDVQVAEALEAIPRSFMIGAGEMIKIEGETGASEATKAPVDEAIKSFWIDNDLVIEESSLALKPATPATASAVPTVAEAAGASIAAESQVTAEAREMFDKGYAAGMDEARKRFSPDAGSVPEGYVSEAELKSIRRSILLQHGVVIAGGVISAGGAALMMHGLVLESGGDAANGASELKTGAIISACALPFFVFSLFINP